MAPSVADIKAVADETVNKVVDNIAQLKLVNQEPTTQEPVDDKADPVRRMYLAQDTCILL